VNSYFTRTTPDIAHLKNPLAKRFIQSYHRHWQADPNSLQAAAYAAAQVLIRALRLTLATTPSLNQIREAVRIQTASAGEIPTAIGRVSFDRNGDLLNPYISFYRYDEHFSANFVNQLIVRS
jgi:ABC-type branched-subunit amino acid transport system substrate-binding protein